MLQAPAAEAECSGGGDPAGRREGPEDQAARRGHWRSYGDDKLPTGAEALAEPFAAFPSWFMRIECDRCGKVRMVSEVHTPQRAMPICDIRNRSQPLVFLSSADRSRFSVPA